MTLRELLAAIEALGLDPETEVAIQSERDGAYSEFEIQLCTYEHYEGSLIVGPDPEGWGEDFPRELQRPILTFNGDTFGKRIPIMF